MRGSDLNIIFLVLWHDWSNKEHFLVETMDSAWPWNQPYCWIVQWWRRIWWRTPSSRGGIYISAPSSGFSATSDTWWKCSLARAIALNKTVKTYVTLSMWVGGVCPICTVVREFDFMEEDQYNYRKTVLDATENFSQHPSSKTTYCCPMRRKRIGRQQLQ